MRERLVWVDAARGLCVLAVVLMHVTAWFNLPRDISAVVDTFRMPVLFTLSGFLLSSRIRAGWRDPRNIARVLNLAYLYVLWMGIYFAVSKISPVGFPGSIPSLKSLLVQFLLPTSTILWFIYALAFYTVLLLVLRRVPPARILIAASCVAVLTCFLPPEVQAGKVWVHILVYGMFFVLGAHGAPVIAGATMRLKRPLNLVGSVVLASIVYVSFAELRPAVNLGPAVGMALWLTQCLAAVALAIVLVIAVTRLRGIARLLGFVGRRTLTIYLLHPICLIGLAVVPGLLDGLSAFGVAAPLLLVFPVGVACLAGDVVIKRTPMRFLLEIPQRLQRTLQMRIPSTPASLRLATGESVRAVASAERV